MNNQLQQYLREQPQDAVRSASAPSVYAWSRSSRLLRHRLGKQDIEALIKAFMAGAPKHVLAERYHISLTSVKRLLRERGVRGKQHRRQC